MSDDTIFDVIIVGSGPAGTAAAMKLAGLKVVILDIGHQPECHEDLKDNFYTIKRQPERFARELIGDNCESMEGIFGRYIMPKLKAPLQRYVLRDYDRFGRLISESFQGMVSYAEGGLANAWGAVMLRYLDQDLLEFPLTAADLEPYYDELTEEIGIAGTRDDLTPFYGSTKGLLPPVAINSNSHILMRRYNKMRAWFQQHDLHIGHPRVAVLTHSHNGRPQHDYNNLEFFKPRIRSIYTPAFTLQRLVQGGGVQYLNKRRALWFRDQEDRVTVAVLNLKSGQRETFQTRKLLIACGALNSARLVLASFKAFGTRLPLMDNLLSYIPFVNPFMLGWRHETHSLYLQLNLCYTGDPHYGPVTGCFYAMSGLLTADFLTDMPFSIRSNLEILKWVMPSMLILHLWYPSKIDKTRNYLWMEENGDIFVHYNDQLDGRVERKLITALAKIGYFSLLRFCKFPKPGNSFHYAGTLPMRAHPNEFETDSTGKLYGTNNVYIIDGSVFSLLPAKHPSLTIMANAMRVADAVRKTL